MLCIIYMLRKNIILMDNTQANLKRVTAFLLILPDNI